MALLFCDGFDKYGGVNVNNTVVVGLVAAGDWTSATGTLTIAAGLSATGYALGIVNVGSVIKTLPASYGRLIGGMRFSNTLGNTAGIQFYDAGTSQASIVLNTNGTIAVKNGIWTGGGTILGTSTASVTANTIHYLEWDISFGNSASIQLFLDGVSILGPSTGDTTATANNTASGIGFIGTASTGLTVDDLYLFDTTGSANNAVLLTSPRIETQFPSGDGAVQFAVGVAILGSTTQRGGSPYNATANNLYVRPFIPSINCTLSAVGMLPGATNGTIQLRPVVYADNAGVPGTLMSAGSTIVGITSGAYLTLSLTTPQTLVAGTRYWLGLMNDIAVTSGYAAQDTSVSGRFVVATFASGAPGTCPATTGNQNAAVVFGVVTSPSNTYCVSQNPVQGVNSYVYDATVGHEDLYNFPALTASAPTIYAAAIKASISKSDAGAKTVSLRTKSGATDSAGSASSLAPGTSFGWATSLFVNDPNTGSPWTLVALNAAQSGIKVES